MKLIKGEFNEKLELQFANSIKAGFPSPAEDYLGESLDFNRDMIRNPEATFYGQVEGNSMICQHWTGPQQDPGEDRLETGQEVRGLSPLLPYRQRR